MKLYGTIGIHVSGEQILRRAGWLDRVRRAFGGEPDLRTGRMRASLEATAVVDAVRGALRTLGVNDAVSLVIDDLVVFHDRDRRPDDLGDLFLAFHDHSSVIGGGFEVLRLAVEHVDAGVHHVIEVQARTDHGEGEPAVRIIISGRIGAFEARPGEDAAAYKARVEPLLADRSTIELARVAFESIVSRVRDAVAGEMPDAHVELLQADLRVQQPSAGTRSPRKARPDDAHYDPHDAYYPSPMAGVLGVMAWSSLAMMMIPNVTTVDAGNQPIDADNQPADAGTDDPGPADAGAEPEGGDGAGDWFGDAEW